MTTPFPKLRTRRRCHGSVPALALVSLLLSACTAIGPTISEREASELGPYPDDYRMIVRRWIEDSLVGITAVESIHISEPEPGFADSLLSKRRYGWWTRTRFKARDRIGMPTGTIAYALLIRNGEVIARQKQLD
jgi:hypothetical protein